jgi:hypothetical protein
LFLFCAIRAQNRPGLFDLRCDIVDRTGGAGGRRGSGQGMKMMMKNDEDFRPFRALNLSPQGLEGRTA